MLLADNWKDYTLIDSGSGRKLEKWGAYILDRPDPQSIWPKSKSKKEWAKADAIYHRNSKGGGYWEYINEIPEVWQIDCDNLKFYVQPTGFKHTGIFPEQYVNWMWIINKVKSDNRKINILNLFAYTGGATIASAYAGADVCHVDAAKAMVNRAKENLILSGLKDKKVRFIIDDVMKFVKKEIRRGNKYDAIIMDPPSYGRGPKGEMWKIEDELYPLINDTLNILSNKPLFYIINSYTTGLSAGVLKNLINMTLGKKYGGISNSDELGIPIKNSNIVLPCGIVGRWELNG